MNLFPEPAPIEPSPAEIARRAAKRAAWVKRQRRCRAKRKMTPAEKLLAQSAVAAAIRAKESAQLVFSIESEDISTLGHEWFFLHAMQLGGWVARTVFENVTPEDFTQRVHRLVFAAAAKIHARGHVVTIAGLHAQLKRDQIVLGDVSCYALGNIQIGRIAPGDVENRALKLKQA